MTTYAALDAAAEAAAGADRSVDAIQQRESGSTAISYRLRFYCCSLRMRQRAALIANIRSVFEYGGVSHWGEKTQKRLHHNSDRINSLSNCRACVEHGRYNVMHP
jgi:hypothetical protein